MPKVSVILTTHGEGKYLGQAIGSVLAQTFEDWELLVVRDGGDGPTYWATDQRISTSVLAVPGWMVNRYAHTINQTFKETKGAYITYLCHDDLYLPWRLEAMARTLDGNPDVHVVYGQQQMMEERGGVTFLTGVRDTVGVTKDAPFHIDHSSVMHRRECFEKVDGWDENAPMRSGDAFFWARLHKAGYAFYPIEAPLDCHRYNDQSVSYLIDHEPIPVYPPYDDMGNKRTILNAVDCDYSAIDK